MKLYDSLYNIGYILESFWEIILSWTFKDEFKVRVPAKESDSKDKTTERQKKIEKHVEKLQKRLVQIHREIEKLETAEVDWDGDDWENNSPYLKEDRYKKKAVQINKAIRKLQNESLSNARILEEKLKVKDDEIKKEWIILTHITAPRWSERGRRDFIVKYRFTISWRTISSLTV